MSPLNSIEIQTSDVDTYLNRYESKDHKLAYMVNNPDSELGTQFTPREIAQQPLLWRKTVRYFVENASSIKSFLKKSGLFNKNNRSHIILTGAGTSDYVGLSLADLYRTTFKTPSNNWATTRITASPGDYLSDHHDYLVIHFARSGNSPESRAVLDLALKDYRENTYHVVITCNPDGELATIAKLNPDKVYLILLPEESNDKGLAMTSSFSTMVTAGQCLANLDNIETFESLIENVSESAEYFIDEYTDLIYDLADPSITRAFYLGNKDLLGAANESALKVQELTVGQLIAKAEDTLTFRHGPISAVDSNTVVCFFLSEDPFTFRYELDVVEQYYLAFKEIGVKSVVVGSGNLLESNVQPMLKFVYDPKGKWNIPYHYQVNIAILFGQIFGLFAAFRRKINIDNPAKQNGLYSRIVQGVRVYQR
jgi:tagatose-6-phosphate ketose/aldose isomerase